MKSNILRSSSQLIRSLAIFFLLVSHSYAAGTGRSSIVDSETGLSFQYPSNFLIEHSDLWLIPTDGVHGPDGVYWNIFNTDFFTGSLKERCLMFGSNLAVSDGGDGGTVSKPFFLGTLQTKTGDEVLLFELKIHG